MAHSMVSVESANGECAGLLQIGGHFVESCMVLPDWDNRNAGDFAGEKSSRFTAIARCAR